MVENEPLDPSVGWIPVSGSEHWHTQTARIGKLKCAVSRYTIDGDLRWGWAVTHPDDYFDKRSTKGCAETEVQAKACVEAVARILLGSIQALEGQVGP